MDGIPPIVCTVCNEPNHRPSHCPSLGLPSNSTPDKEDAKYGQAGDDEDD